MCGLMTKEVTLTILIIDSEMKMTNLTWQDQKELLTIITGNSYFLTFVNIYFM